MNFGKVVDNAVLNFAKVDLLRAICLIMMQMNLYRNFGKVTDNATLYFAKVDLWKAKN